ncbi:flagellar protein FlbF [Candidatus Borreliella tachyglossi]|uniref:Flagellar protein FlbF n=1 Tax=Candidatus Borreliella tachyglossi TaxID=1964448 RepID=A0A2S1LWB2_9SPIR|nr:flagellar protein FlbF [Candidatus Borreliella tachyglossi]AWG42570.1 flagellar protein FlbF [Candidatus Borreliella tachyglossi]
MKIKLETELKNTLQKEVILIEDIYDLYLNLKKYLDEKNETMLKATVNKTNSYLCKFKDVEQRRGELWLEFIGNKKFESTYMAIEQLCEVYKKEIYNYFHRLRIGMLNIKSLNHLISSYVETSLDVLDLIFKDVQESVENVTYKNPYGPKNGNLNEASVLINKKL